MGPSRLAQCDDGISLETPKKKLKTTPRKPNTPNRKSSKGSTPNTTSKSGLYSSSTSPGDTLNHPDYYQLIHTNSSSPIQLKKNTGKKPGKSQKSRAQAQQELNLLVVDPDDTTSFHSGQATWTIDNLPDILYVLEPGPEHARPATTPPTSPIFVFGKRVKNYLLLPRQISSNVEGWRLEAWMRTDRRVTAEDILDRINPKFGITVEDLNARRAEFLHEFHLVDWDSDECGTIKSKLTAAGIDPSLNSTRGLTPGLIDPARGEAGGRIPIPPGFRYVLVPRGNRTPHPDDHHYPVPLPGDIDVGIFSSPLPVHELQPTGNIDINQSEGENTASEDPFVDIAFTNPEADALAHELTLRTQSPPIDSEVHCSKYFHGSTQDLAN